MASRRLGTTLGALAILGSVALVPVTTAPAQAVAPPEELAPLLRDEDGPVVAGFATTIDLTRMARLDQVPVTSYAVADPAHGRLEGDCAAGTCTYVPDEGHVGADDLTVTATNAAGTSRPATLRLTTRPNQAPGASDDLRILSTGAPHTWQIGASDERRIAEDGIVVVTEPEHGDVACTAETCTYEPDPGFLGEDLFTWRADDGLLVSDVATTHLVVRPNVPPVLLDHTLLVASGASAAVAGEATDTDGAPRTYRVAAAPRHGTVGACDATGCTYTADAGYVGTDAFTWQAGDGRSWSAPARVLVSVHAERRAPSAARESGTAATVPVALSGDYRAATGRPTRWRLHLQQPGTSPVVAIVTAPAHGTVTGCSGTLCEYVPDAGYVGDDLFTWRATTGADTTDIAEARISVFTPRAPRADGPTTTTRSMGRTSRIFFDTENWSADLERVVIETQPAHGRIDHCSSLVCLYTADADYTGPDSFTWRADDGERVSAPLTTTVTVVDPATLDVPDITVDAVAGRAVTIRTAGRVARVPERGHVSCAYGDCVYRPAPGVTGTDTFELVSRLAPTAPRTTVTVRIRSDRAPVARAWAPVYLPPAQHFSLLVTDPDEELGHTFEVQVVRQPQHGRVTSCTSASCVYEPDPGFRGIDEFSWRATDGRNLSGVVTQRLVVGQFTVPEPRVTLTSPTRRPRVGAASRWTATVRGSALEDLREATVAWRIPDVLRVQPRSLPRGCTLRERRVRCVLGTLPAGATRTLRLRATPVQARPATLAVRLHADERLLARAERRLHPTGR